MKWTKAYGKYELTHLSLYGNYQVQENKIDHFEIVPVENVEVMDAFGLREDPSNGCKDYKDTLQYICAKKIGTDFIVIGDQAFVGLNIETRDTK